MPYQRSFTFQLGTGLTLEAVILDSSGTIVGSPISTGFHEVSGSGWYQWIGNIPDAHRGSLLIRGSGGGTVYYRFAVNPEEVEGNINLVQDVPIANVSGKTSQNVGDCLSVARADGAGGWEIDGSTLYLYGPDGTIVREFTLAPPGTTTLSRT